MRSQKSATLASLFAVAVGVAVGSAVAAGCGGAPAPAAPPAQVPVQLLWSSRPALEGADLAAVWGSGPDVFAAGNGAAVARSTDGGQTFELVSSGAAGAPRFRQLSGTSGTDVWLAGAATDGAALLLHSSDHGASWQPRQAGDARDLRAVWALDAQRVVLATGDGAIYLSRDGGAVWSQVFSAPAATLSAIWGTSEGVLYATGGQSAALAGGPPSSASDGCDGGGQPAPGADGEDHGLLLSSPDGGQSWVTLGVATEGPLLSVWGTPDGRFVVASGKRSSMAWTSDGGQHWLADGRATAKADEDLTGVWVGPGDGALFIASPAALIRNVRYVCSGSIQLSTESLPPAPDGAAGVAAIWGPGSDDVWAVGPGGAIRHRP